MIRQTTLEIPQPNIVAVEVDLTLDFSQILDSIKPVYAEQ